MTQDITFRTPTLSDTEMIFAWLDTPHMQEFWDNSQEHRDDIVNFIKGRKTPSPYFEGMMTYWLSLVDGSPFALVMTHYETALEDTPEPYRSNVSKTGKTVGLDFGIGNEEYLGKGLASLTLRSFMTFMVKKIDHDVDRFMIDPSTENPRAIHVYQQAGFEIVTTYVQEGGYFDQKPGYLMIKDV